MVNWVSYSYCSWSILQPTSSEEVHSIQVPRYLENSLSRHIFALVLWAPFIWIIIVLAVTLTDLKCFLGLSTTLSPKKVLQSVKKCVLRTALVHSKVSFKVVDAERYLLVIFCSHIWLLGFLVDNILIHMQWGHSSFNTCFIPHVAVG